jgi:hypothetical protein
LLPLKLNTGEDQRELDRARFLITSLRYFWTGETPFSLHVVARDDEIREIERAFIPFDAEHFEITFHSESEFFSTASKFHSTKSMYKQQLIKLFAPWKLALGGFIAFDADVVCLRKFGERTFVRDGRIVSGWEPRAIHSWWKNSMAGLRAWSDDDVSGMGVTPNTLHSEICREVARYIEMRGFDPVDYLCGLTESHPKMTMIEGEGIPLVWSEYSLYTIVGEWFSDLYRYHLTPQEVAEADVVIHSRRNVWSRDERHRLVNRGDDPGYFLVVQSWAGIPIEEIQAKVGVPFSWDDAP